MEYTIRVIDSLKHCQLKNVEVVIFDDASEDGTVQWCQKNDIEIHTKDKSKGLTHSWNEAYKKFKYENYTHLVLANNDIIVPKNSIDNLVKTNKQFIISGPLSTEKGVGHQPLQNVRIYHEFEYDEYNFENTQFIQDRVSPINDCIKVDYINGFVFSMNRRIIDFELDDGNLFNPKNINVGNESELCQRVGNNIGIALDSYIFHFKGISFENITSKSLSIEDNIYRELNWKEAQKMKKNWLFRMFFLIRRKLSK